MMITVTQQIQNVLRNRRFIIFTLIFPSLWYLFFMYQFKNAVAFNATTLAVFSGMFGVAGSGINTFSTRVAREKKYYDFMNKISPYNKAKYLFDSLITQTMLNVMIILTITLTGLLFGNMTIEFDYIKMVSILMYYGFYYIIIGYILGTLFDDETLTSVSFPIFMGFMLINLTPNAVSFNGLKFLGDVQKIFPGYYFNDAISHIHDSQKVMVDFGIISIHLLIVLGLVSIVSMYKKYRTGRNA
uniref:ABC-2 type transporter domain-containing protein n=2 Tax=Bacillus cereus TaxID=1396 RepID=J8D9V8_BACCE|nr:hypothetical protein IGC_05144 [Bacillus cereus HuA4-10]